MTSIVTSSVQSVAVKALSTLSAAPRPQCEHCAAAGHTIYTVSDSHRLWERKLNLNLGSGRCPQYQYVAYMNVIALYSSICKQDGSMVEIKREAEANLGSPMTESAIEDEKYRLLYSKSKVYIHPTAYSRDNIPGFVTLVKRVSFSLYSLSQFCSVDNVTAGSRESEVFARMDTRDIVERKGPG